MALLSVLLSSLELKPGWPICGFLVPSFPHFFGDFKIGLFPILWHIIWSLSRSYLGLRDLIFANLNMNWLIHNSLTNVQIGAQLSASLFTPWMSWHCFSFRKKKFRNALFQEKMTQMYVFKCLFSCGSVEMEEHGHMGKEMGKWWTWNRLFPPSLTWTATMAPFQILTHLGSGQELQ